VGAASDWWGMASLQQYPPLLSDGEWGVSISGECPASLQRSGLSPAAWGEIDVLTALLCRSEKWGSAKTAYLGTLSQTEYEQRRTKDAEVQESLQLITELRRTRTEVQRRSGPSCA
jgi:hypothetical protein